MTTHPLRSLMTLSAVLAIACMAALPAGAQGTTSEPRKSSVEAHVARATELAGKDLTYLMRLCQPQPAERAKPGPGMDDFLRKLIARPAPEPMQVFDNLYFVGGDWVSAWVLKTSEGLILIDALNNADEARALIEGGLAKLGLDPKQLKYLVVTHGHGDHYGGAKYLAEKYRPRVVSSDADWNMMGGVLEFSSAAWDPPPARDLSVGDLQTLTLGDTTLTFYVTTGHTHGTLSVGFDVRNGTQVHKAILWGGTSFNFGKDFSRLTAYSGNTDRFVEMARRAPLDVMLSNHPEWDGSIAKMKALRAEGARAKHPYVIGPEGVARAMGVMGECSRAQSMRFGY